MGGGRRGRRAREVWEARLRELEDLFELAEEEHLLLAVRHRPIPDARGEVTFGGEKTTQDTD